MKSFLKALAFAACANALATRDASCCFGLSALVSGTSSTVGQLSDGQNRVGGGLPPATYCLTDTTITDKNGRGCIITAPETQFQCDSGASPAPNFTIGCDGLVSHDGNTTFWECATGDNGEDNIYTTPGGTNCAEIQLKASSCAPSCAPPPPPPPPSAPQSCVPNFTNSNTFQFPHLLVPIDSSNPNQSKGTSYFATITPSISTIFNFDIPQSYAGKLCSLYFLFPSQSELTTSSFTFSGDGKLSFSELEGPVGAGVTFNSRPQLKSTYPGITVAPGAVPGGYVVASFECQGGSTVAFEMGGAGTELTFFEDYNPSAIGVYIFPC